MARNRRKISLKKILCLILVGVVAVTVIGGVAAFAKKDTKTLSSTIFSRGGLDENGDYVNTNKSIFTEEMFECLGLVVTPDIKFNGTYQIFYYNYDGVYLSKSPVYEKTTRLNIPELAKYARIVLTIDDDDDIDWFEKYKYANLVEIKVQKEQNFVLYDYFNIDTTRPDTVVSYDEEIIYGKHLYWGGSEDSPDTVMATGYSPLIPITVKDWKNIVLVFDDAVDSEHIIYFFTKTDTDGNEVIVPVGTFQKRLDGGSYEVLIEVPEGAEKFYSNTLTDTDYHYSIYRYN